MDNLVIESAELNGAIKLLAKLQANFGSFMSIGFAESNTPKEKRLLGDALLKFLLSSKDNMSAYLYYELRLVAEPITKNGKIVGYEVKTK